MVSTKNIEIGWLFKNCLMMKRLQLPKSPVVFRNHYFIGILQMKLREDPLRIVKCNYEIILTMFRNTLKNLIHLKITAETNTTF